MSKKKRAVIVIGCTIAVMAAVALITFHPWRPSLPMYSLRASASPSAAGYVAVYPLGGKYAPGVELTLQAVPNLGYRFVTWSGDISGTDKWTTMTMGDSNKNVIAIFESAEQTPYEASDEIIPYGSYVSFPSNGVRLQEGQRIRLSASGQGHLQIYLFTERQFEHFKPDLIPLLGYEGSVGLGGTSTQYVHNNATYYVVIANRLPSSQDAVLQQGTLTVQEPDPWPPESQSHGNAPRMNSGNVSPHSDFC